jgi:transposase
MEESRKRRSFDKDFKLSAVRMVIEGNQSLSSVARDLGIAENTLQNWKKKYLKENAKQKNETAVDMAEYKRVLKENAILKEQRDILKKAVTFFSQHEK